MDIEEAIESIPNIKICLDDLRVFTQSSDPSPKKVNQSKVKFDTLKQKTHYQQLQSLQQTPKISRISQLLTSPSSAKSSYVINIKNHVNSVKTLPKTPKKIDYSRYNSLSQFAISKAQVSNSPPALQKEETNEVTENKDMYAKGQAYIKKKKERLEKEIRIIDEESKKLCTFAPDIKAKADGKRKRGKGDQGVGNKYKAISPFVSEVGYKAGCDLDSLKEKCTVMESYLTVKMPNS